MSLNRKAERHQFDLSWEQALWATQIVATLLISVTDHTIDLEVINTFLEVGKFTNMEFANNKDKLHLKRRPINCFDFEPPRTTLI